MNPDKPDFTSSYQNVLSDFLKVSSEEALYKASLLSKSFIEQGIGPEDIVALHSESMEKLLRGVPYIEQARVMALSLQFLLEVMITYGIRYKEYLDLKMTETTRAIQMQLQVERARAEEAVRLEQARAEERIRAQQEGLQSKEEFLAFIAHELRNPITVIKGSLEYALRRANQEGSERVQTALASAERGLDQLMHLTNELLMLSREESVELKIGAEPVAMRELIANAVEECRPQAAPKNVTLRFEPQESVATVIGDDQWLRSVIDNLLENAIKYTNEGGEVVVKTINQPRRLQIDVIDTGIGIAPDALPYIFDKYYRVQHSGGFVKGTGLGLALVKRIIERHGGDVRVQSQVGQGSVFSIYLPLGPQEGKQQ